jgi:hypothetical protein
VVGIQKDIQIAQRLEIKHRSLKGRVIALDLVLPSSDGHCHPHRLIGAYAPWNPGDDGISRSFWMDLTALCKMTASAWTLAGDLNATVSSFERTSGGVSARTQFLQFLADTNTYDLWINYPDRSKQLEWTCRGHYSDDGPISVGSIIDRIVTSGSTLADSEIFVANRHTDWIPFTDHRAVVGRVTHTTPSISRDGNLDHTDNFIRQSSNKPRVRLPRKNEKDKYQTFADEVDVLIQTNELDKLTSTNDETFLKLYSGLLTIIITTAAKVFGKPNAYMRHKEIVTNRMIQSIVSNIRHVGGAIYFGKSDGSAHVSLKAMKLHSNALRSSSPSNSVHHILTKNRKTLHKQLFAEHAKEIMARAKVSDKRKITAALMGNSTRKLAHNFDYVPLPLAVNDLNNPDRLVCNPEEVKRTTMDYFKNYMITVLSPHFQSPG